jgi:hypothetical protein
MYRKVLLLLALISTSIACQAQQLLISRTNALANADFESVKQGKIEQWKLPDNAADDDAQFHDGKISLKLNGKAARQEIAIVPAGTTVRFGVWMRGENVQGVADIDAASDGISAHTAPLTGTFNWTWRESTFTIPTDSRHFTVHLNPGSGGTVWFDGAVVQQLVPPMQVFLRWPNYRHLLPRNNNAPLCAAVELADSDGLPQSLHLESTFKNATGTVIARADFALKDGRKTQFVELPLRQHLQNGDYNWHFTLKTNTGKILQETAQPVHVVEKMPQVYIDKTGRMIRNGKPFFPFGIYLGEKNDSTDADLARISAAGFNTIIDYQYGYKGEDPQHYMDDAQKNNLAVIFSLKDLYHNMPGAYADSKLDTDAVTEKLVDQFKSYPALLAWYTNDESAPINMPLLREKYEQVKMLDPDHPTFITLFREGQYGKYFSTTDITSSDWYPYGWAPWSDVSKWTQDAKSSTRGALGVWTVTQIHNGTLYRGGDKPQDPVYTPTYQAMKNFAFQAIANGANGLLFYSYFDLWYNTTKREKSQAAFDKRWPDVAKVASDIRAIIPILENGEDVPIKVLSGGVAVRAVNHQNQLYLFTANPYGQARQLSVQLAGAWKTSVGKTTAKDNGTLWEYNFAPRDSVVIHFTQNNS